MGWDTTQYATYNIPMGTSLNSCYGFYNSSWQTNSGWPTGNNYSLCQFMKTYSSGTTLSGVTPYVYNMNGKNSSSSSNLTTAFIRYEDRRFYFSVNSSNASEGGVTTGTPMPQGSSTTTFISAININVLSNDQTYIGIKALPAYNYSFINWRYNTASGTIWNSVA